VTPRQAKAPLTGYPEGCIHELFERQAGRTPDRVALISGDERVTFAELNLRANQIARCLVDRGVGRETLVGLCVSRSVEAIVALIGILKAGGAHVYLDPGYPSRRLREMAQDSGLKLVVTTVALRKSVFSDTTGFGFLDPASAEVSRQSAANMASCVDLDDAAYVIYTSGSTGKPKGAVQIHRSMTSRLISAPLPDIQPTDVCCLNSSLAFGISASRLFFPLVLGASVVVIEDDAVKDVRRFVKALESNRVTSVFMVPALLRQVLHIQEAAGCRLQSLRAVTVSGGALTPDLVDRFRGKLPQAQLINIYGSTEIGTTATLGLIDSSTPSERVSIGRPVANTKVYILDANSNPVPDGVAGEICVAARHLAREYLNEPDLTAERFVTDPFGRGTSERICKTGDLGRYLPNGEIEFLGRADHQVKIRGYRIELGEIEAILLSHHAVTDAVVAVQGSEEEKRLVAYVVGSDSAPLNAVKIRKFLGDRLPAYMIPSTFVTLPELPRTDAGKIDRRALPKPPQETKDHLPETQVERTLAGLWSELLKVDEVSVHDNFIELGGDSLAATQLVASIHGRFGANIPARLVFDATLGEIALEVSLARIRHPPFEPRRKR
jgi:amino acid adenylation domain-containing protein